MIEIKVREFEYEKNSSLSEKYLSLLKEQLHISSDELKKLSKMLKNNSENIVSNFERFNSFLLYGDVQSGKTNNLANIIVELFENKKINLVIYLTGSQNDLMDQNQSRFLELFESLGNEFKIFPNRDLESEYLEAQLKKNYVIINSLKTNKRLEELQEKLQSISAKNNILIIDDEADDYSLSSKSMKISRELISRNNIKYLSITASPFSNLAFNSSFYDYFYVLESPSEYCGINDFKNKYRIENKKNLNISKGFIFWLHQTMSLGLTDSQYLVNTLNTKGDHEKIRSHLIEIWREFKSNFSLFERQIMQYVPELSAHAGNIHNFMQTLNEDNFLISNSESKNFVRNKGFEIIVGGLKLSRGITYKNLLVESMVNMGSSIKAGTLIQRARWFGYRKKTIDDMIIFVDDNVNSALKEIEDLIVWTKKYHINDERKYKKIFDEINYQHIKL